MGSVGSPAMPGDPCPGPRLMTKAQNEGSKVPCPGCGGRGRFEWPANPKVPKRWAPTAACGMCQGTGKVPASWLTGGKAGR